MSQSPRPFPDPSSEPPRVAPAASRSARRMAMRRILSDFELFSLFVMKKPLRPYQLEAARAILHSIDTNSGHIFTVLISRQGGKNELSAQLEAFLLVRAKLSGGTIVKGAPTFRPQLLESIRRLRGCLNTEVLRSAWSMNLGTIALGNASIVFLSGHRTSDVVGHPATLLLEIDEAQGLNKDKFLTDFAPMVASTNATIVLYGTAWTPDTLLEETRRDNARLEAIDGIQRNFVYPASVVQQYVPLYGIHTANRIARMGADHPLFRSQYLCETLNAYGRTFSESQIAQIMSAHPRPVEPGGSGGTGPLTPMEEASAPPRRQTDLYVAGIDLAGEDEEAEDALLRSLHPRRDSTAVAIARVTWENVFGHQEPHLEIVRFYWWTGRKHRELFPQLVDLLKNVWHCQSVVVDATGIGGTIASFLADALGRDISHSFVFTAQSKSVLGYRFISAVNNGRLKLFGWTESLGDGGPSPGPAPPPHQLNGDPSGFQYPDPEVPEAGAIPNLSLREDADAVVEFLKQLRLLRSDFHANERLSFEVDPRDGHDDLVIATALAVEAAYQKLPGVAIGRRRFNPYD